MTLADLLLMATPTAPLLLAVVCVVHARSPLMPAMLPLAPLPALLAALLAHDAPPLLLDADRLRLSLGLDAPAALLLGSAGLLWLVAGVHAAAGLRDGRYGLRFAACWLLAQAGCFGCFVSGDLPGFYLFFTLASLPAYGLVIETGTVAAWRAGAVYLGLAIAGEVCQLFAFAMLASMAPGESLAIADAVQAMASHPWRNGVAGLLLGAFGLKAGLLPMHVWLPLAHPAAPAPASAVLSGTIIKAGIIGLIRFLPSSAVGPDWGAVLITLGFATAFYGVVVGITQASAKTVLAYSSISQMGVIVAGLGAGIATGDRAAPVAVAFYAAHHVLAKGGLFLAVAATPRGLGLLPVVLIAAGFGGLPPTGGYLAKLATKTLLGSGLLGLAAGLSAIGSTMLMLHFVRCLAATGRPANDPVARACWLGAAMLSVAVPWLTMHVVDTEATCQAVELSALLGGLWPVLVGAGLEALLSRLAPWLPRIPAGDIIALIEHRLPTMDAFGAVAVRLQAILEPWPASGLALLLVTLAFWAAMGWMPA